MREESKTRILVIGDDMRIFLTVARSLGRAGYIVHAAPFDWNAPALKSRFISAIHHLPRYSDSPNAWLDEMKKVLAENDIRIVIPCCDRAILPLDRHRAQLEHAKLAIPSPKSIETLFDKLKTKDLARSLGIPMADGEQLRSNESASALIERYGLPLVIKPKRSYTFDHLTTWGRVHIAESSEQLEDVLSSIDTPDGYLVEAYFKGGFGCGISVLAAKGQVIQAFGHRRLREGWAGSSSYRISEACRPAMLEAATKICEALNIDGVCMFEFRCRLDGSWILLEVELPVLGFATTSGRNGGRFSAGTLRDVPGTEDVSAGFLSCWSPQPEHAAGRLQPAQSHRCNALRQRYGAPHLLGGLCLPAALVDTRTRAFRQLHNR